MHVSYLIRQFRSFSELPATYADLMAGEVERHGLFRCAEWFQHLMQTFFDEYGDEPCIYSVEDARSGRPLIVAPLRQTTGDYALPGCRVIASISHPENYTSVAFAFDPGLTDRVGALGALFGHLRARASAGAEQHLHAIRLWPVELGSELGDTIALALRAAGFWVQPYANSHNRFQDTRGLSFDAYFAQRSVNLRYGVRRRQRALEKTGGLEVAIYPDEPDLDRLIDEYASVSLESWKSPSSMISSGIIELIRLAAAKECLRLGILRVSGVPAAAQFWIVSGGTAHCARLAYHEGYKKQAVGVVLTSHLIAYVLDRDHVGRIDFGFGQEDYKGAGCVIREPTSASWLSIPRLRAAVPGRSAHRRAEGEARREAWPADAGAAEEHR